MRKNKFIAAFGALALFAGAAQAQESGALLDLLVRKKVINDQEAEDVRSELAKEAASTTAGKLNLSSSITELKLSGDLRMRYQYDTRDYQVATDNSKSDTRDRNTDQRSRWRFRLRLNADMKLGPQFFGGVQLVTGQASDSDNQTFADSANGAGFSDYSIYISRAFIGYNVNDWATVILGKQANPFYTTDLVWDADINPQGFVEVIRFDKMNFGGSSAAGYSKDGKSFSAPEIVEERPWQLALNLGQFFYQDNNEYNTDPVNDHDSSTDAYMFVGQLVGTYKFNSSTSVTFAPGIMFFNAADLSGFNNENPFSGVSYVTKSGTTFLSGETRKLAILTAPGDVSFKLGTLPTKFYWDFAYNTQGKGRAEDIYRLFSPEGTPTHQSEDDFAYLVGVQFGGGKKQGDWTARVDYRQTGIASVDPNLNDSDFALGELNTRGFKTGLFYNFTDFLNAGVSYMYGWNLRDNLIGGQATNDSKIADSNVVQVLQVDVNLKF